MESQRQSANEQYSQKKVNFLYHLSLMIYIP